MKRYILPLAALAILVIIFGTIYGVTQQAQRNDANYPQIQLAEDTARALNNGSQPRQLATGSVDMNNSLAPFIVIYDKTGNPVAGTGYLNSRLPEAPIGILTSAMGHDYHAISWQPTSDIRIAAITVAAKDYYVLSGRSLKEIEANENQSFLLSFAGGLASLVVLGTAVVLKRHLNK